ncbi:MAG: DNA lyase [Candidatus Aenigmarchaeota archaeon]|nr:DNA lyase [Candidatus Aenigmarchaeota archaeon]
MDSAIAEFIETEQHQKLKENLSKHRYLIDDFFQRVRDLHLDLEKVFFELVFCLCTPQSKAVYCRDAVLRMKDDGLLWIGTKQQLLNYMQPVRFNDKKSDYIIMAREHFDEIYRKILELQRQPRELREWLAENVMGFGFKEASHFLRNIGLGDELAILDVHILREMQELGIMNQANGGLSKNAYLQAEAKFAGLAKALGMTTAELDCTIWLTRSGSGELM